MRLIVVFSLGVGDARNLTEHRQFEVVQGAGVVDGPVEVLATECQAAAGAEAEQQRHNHQPLGVR